MKTKAQKQKDLAQLVPQFLVLRDRHLLETNHHRRFRVLESLDEFLEVFLFLFSRLHFYSLLKLQSIHFA